MAFSKNENLYSKLKDIFDTHHNAGQFLNHLSLWVYANNSNSDLPALAEVLEEDQLIKLVNFFDGADVKIPTKHELKECQLSIILFYYREILGFDWLDIKKRLNLPEIDKKPFFNSVSMSRKVSKIKNQMQTDLMQTFESLSEDEISNYVNRNNVNND